jgi:hypothetical protein
MTAVSPSTKVPIPSRKLPIWAHSQPRSTGVPPCTKCHRTTKDRIRTIEIDTMPTSAPLPGSRLPKSVITSAAMKGMTGMIQEYFRKPASPAPATASAARATT